MLKASKQSVDYSRGHRDGHAFEGDKNYCQHFIEPPKGAADLGACQKVSGAIQPRVWVPIVCSGAEKEDQRVELPIA